MKNTKFLFCLLCSFVLFSCKKDKTDKPTTIEGGIIYNLKIVSIDATNISLTEEEYIGDLDGTQIPLSNAGSNKLYFVVPARVAQGNYQLNISALNLKVNYTVKTPVLNDTPENTILPYKRALANVVQTLDTSIEAQVIISAVNSFNDAFDNHFSNEEKRNAALFYQVNKPLIDYILAGDYTQAIPNGRFFASVNTELKKAMVGTVVFVAGLLGIYYGDATTKLIGIPAAVIGFAYIKKSLKKIHNDGMYTLNLEMDDVTSEIKRSTSALSFESGVAQTINFKTVDRKIIVSDQTNAQNKLLDFFNTYNKFNYWINKGNDVIAILNNIPYVHINPMTQFDLPASSPTFTNPMLREIYNNMTFSINKSGLQLQSSNLLQDGQISIQIKNTTNNTINDYLNYTFSDGFSTFNGRFPIEIGAKRDTIGSFVVDGVTFSGTCTVVQMRCGLALRVILSSNTFIDLYDVPLRNVSGTYTIPYYVNSGCPSGSGYVINGIGKTIKGTVIKTSANSFIFSGQTPIFDVDQVTIIGWNNNVSCSGTYNF